MLTAKEAKNAADRINIECSDIMKKIHEAIEKGLYKTEVSYIISTGLKSYLERQGYDITFSTNKKNETIICWENS